MLGIMVSKFVVVGRMVSTVSSSGFHLYRNLARSLAGGFSVLLPRFS